MKFVSAFFAVLVMFIASLANAAHPYDAACRLSVGNRGGSGTLIAITDGKALVLTVQHVAVKKGRAAQCQWGEQICEGYVLTANKSADVALIVCDAPKGISPVALAAPTPQNGPYVLAGYPGYDRQTLRWQRGNYVEITSDTLFVDCMPEKGMSGGPVYDKYGRVCGAVSAYDPIHKQGLCGSSDAMIELVAPYLK